MVTQTEVKEIVKSEIKKFINDILDKEMKKILHTNGSESRDELVVMVKNAFDAVYKTMWQRKDFWQSGIK